jgi:peptidoglycan hydrolase-like protein with peptidoglycan-binding domain
MTFTEIPANQSITLEALANNTELAKEVQINLIRLGLLDPPADGKLGSYSRQALEEFQSLMNLSESGLGIQTRKALAEVKEIIPLQLGNDFASRIIKYMQQKQYFVAVGKQKYNIVYVEGANSNGVPNDDTFNQWNDRRIVIEIASATPKIVGNWVATTEPGDYYTQNPLNPEGAARIAFNQYKAWQVGSHGESDRHEALVQVADVKVHRDRNKDGYRTSDPTDVGTHFGINQHWGYDMSSVGKASAGCLVGQSREEHRAFMKLIKQDRRYQMNNNYIFMTTVIPGDDLVKAFPPLR